MFYFISMVIITIVIASVFYIVSHFANLNKENRMSFEEWSLREKSPEQLLKDKNTSDLVESIALSGRDVKLKASCTFPACKAGQGYTAVVFRHGVKFDIMAGISSWDSNPVVHIDDVDVSESVNGRFVVDALFVLKTDEDNLLSLKAKEERALKAQEKFQEMRGGK